MLGSGDEKGIDVELDEKASVHALLVMLGVPENEARPHDALGDLTPAEYMEQNASVVLQ
jgi:hypothetical protein